MATYGFCENKCKYEVYTKDEVDSKLEEKSSTSHNHDTKYKLQGDFAVVSGSIGESDVTVAYPEGFTKDNCVVLSAMMKMTNDTSSYGYGSVFNSTIFVNGTTPIAVSLTTNNILISAKKILLSSEAIDYGSLETEMNYKIVLMKV